MHLTMLFHVEAISFRLRPWDFYTSDTPRRSDRWRGRETISDDRVGEAK